MPGPTNLPNIYDPEGLYNLASSAGISGFASPTGVSAPALAASPDQEPDPQDRYESREQENPALLPGTLTPPAPLNLPESPQNAPKATEVKEGGGFGASVSRKFTPEGKISQRDQELARANQAGEAKIQAEAAPVVQAQAEAKTAGESGVVAQTQAMVDKTLQEGRSAEVLNQLQQGFMKTELEANAKATAMENQAKTDYLAALNDFRAQRINPFGSEMSGGQRFGVMMSAFAHDFLGAKGIKTSAMDTLNKAMDRYLDTQIQGIKQKGQVAEGFKTLWDMQRAQSASDAEARTRVRGFMLESAKQSLIATMAPYESALASANGKAAMAKIDEEYAKNMIQVYSHISANVNAMRNANVAWAGDKLKADAQNYATSVHAQQVALQRQQYEDQKKAMGQIPEGDVIIDPESNKGKWVFKLGISEPEKKDTRDRMAAIQDVNKTLNDIRQLNREIAPVFDAIKGTRVMDEPQRRYEAMTLLLAHQMAKANGERATDKDVDQFRASFPMDTFFTRGGVESIIAYTQEHALRPAYNNLQQKARDLPPEQWTTGPVQKPFAAAEADAHATVAASSATAKAAKENNPVDKAIQYMTAPDANDTANKADYKAAGIDKDSFKLAWNDWQDKYAPPPSKGGNYENRKVFEGKDEPPAWAVSLESLKERALEGNRPAMEALAKEATDYRVHDAQYNDDSDREIRRAFALYELHQISKIPHTAGSSSESAPTIAPAPGTITDRPQSLKYLPKNRR